MAQSNYPTSSPAFNWGYNSQVNQMPYGTPNLSSAFPNPTNYYGSYSADYNQSCNSSGYYSASDSTSYNSPMFNPYYYNNQQINQASTNQQSYQVNGVNHGQKSAKRPRTEEPSSNMKAQQLVDKIFESPKTTNNQKNKRSYKKRAIAKPEAKYDVPIRQDDLDDLDDDDFDLNEFEKENILSININNTTLDNNDFTDSFNIDGKKKRVLTKSQREAANQRERKRMNIMNQSFVDLRAVLPISTGRKRRKMSRLDIVVGAIEYIAYLDELLKNNDFPCEINFDAYQNSMLMYE